MRTSVRVVIASATAVAMLLIAGCSGGDGNPASPAPAGVPELHALLPDSVRESGKLIVATDANYPPCDFTNEDGEIDGYNHDFLMGIAEKLGVTVEQESIAFDGLIPGVQGGKYLAAMECISDRAERQEQVMFIDNAYATSGVLTLAKNPAKVSENPLSLCGVKVGLHGGTDHITDEQRYSANCEKHGEPRLVPTEFPDATAVNTALQSGRIEASFINLTTGAWQEKQTDGAVKIFASPLMPKVYNGIIVAHESEDLAKAFQGALEKMIEDGSYQEVLEKWNLSELALLEPGINLATERPLPELELCGSCGR
ncbi:MAG: ABC transporter substrate-binding protein [Microbacterium sp.]